MNCLLLLQNETHSPGYPKDSRHNSPRGKDKGFTRNEQNTPRGKKAHERLVGLKDEWINVHRPRRFTLDGCTETAKGERGTQGRQPAAARTAGHGRLGCQKTASQWPITFSDQISFARSLLVQILDD